MLKESYFIRKEKRKVEIIGRKKNKSKREKAKNLYSVILASTYDFYYVFELARKIRREEGGKELYSLMTQEEKSLLEVEIEKVESFLRKLKEEIKGEDR